MDDLNCKLQRPDIVLVFQRMWVRGRKWCVCVCAYTGMCVGIVRSFYIPSVHHCRKIRLVLHCVALLIICVY